MNETINPTLIKELTTLVTLSNAVELATNIIKDVIGDNVAGSINDQKLNRDAIAKLVASKININLSK